MDTPLSDGDIKRRLHVPVIKYSDLRKLNTLPDACVILLEWSKNGIGHWVCLFHIGDKPYYFNSFGERFDQDLNCLSRSARIILGENGNEIERLLNGQACEYNKTKYQCETSSTCGRHVCYRIINKNLSSTAYLKKLNKFKKQYGSYDEAILELVH